MSARPVESPGSLFHAPGWAAHRIAATAKAMGATDAQMQAIGQAINSVPPARLAAAEAAAAHADKAITPTWSDDATAFLRAYSRTVDSFLIEDAVRRWNEQGLPAPPDSRAWGSVARKLAVAGELVPYGVGRDAFGSYKSRWRAAQP